MRLRIDLDGIVVDTVSYWVEEINKVSGENLTPQDITCWDVHKCTNIGKECYDIMNTGNFFQNPEPMTGAIETLKDLQNLGHEIVIVTAVPFKSETAHYDKYKWCQQHLSFLNIDESFIATQRKDLVIGDILFDDKPQNLETFVGKGVILDHPYNKNWKEQNYGVKRVYNWQEFFDFICQY